MPEFTGTSDVRGYLRILWRWKWLFLFFVVATPIAAYLIEQSQPTRYRSSALVGVSQATVNTSLLNGGGSFSTNNVTAIAKIVTTTPVATVAADLLHPPAQAGEIVSEVSASGDADTNFVTISAEDRSAVRAAAIANAFAHAISQSLQSKARGQIDSAIKGVRAQLSQLGRNDATRPALVAQLNQLRAARATQGSEAAILQPGTVPSSPASLNARRAVEIGLVIGLLLGFGAVVLAESADRRLRTPGDLEAMSEVPLLAAIAPSAFSAQLDTKEDEEAFHMLRTALMVFNPGKQLKSVLVTSAGEKEGKTTVAVRLALVCAGSGMNVILIDADLRRAQVSARLGIHEETGLGTVLAGECSLEEALYHSDGAASGRLRVVPAGPTPDNPAALISSDAMRRVLRDAEARSDLVIVDTPAALAVSDSLPLMSAVSGVVLVARMNRSSRVTVRRLQRVIEAAGGTPLGVVATGVTTAMGYEHYSPKYYTHPNANGSTGLFRRRKEPAGTSSEPAGPSSSEPAGTPPEPADPPSSEPAGTSSEPAGTSSGPEAS
jgi:receptor protein-tyrosine kinase